MKNFCANCGKLNPESVIFCNHCGAKMFEGMDSLTNEIRRPKDDPGYSGPLPPLSKPEKTKLALYLINAETTIELEEKESLVLGRATKDTTFFPDVDLGPYDGFKNGVSRKHAIIHISKEGTSISDLRSSNGTFINDRRLPPHLRVPLHHGDIITLGILQIQFLRSKNE
jgi:pSer/pThr/pTyr-binding forkhead associated (FHA) protein